MSRRAGCCCRARCSCLRVCSSAFCRRVRSARSCTPRSCRYSGLKRPRISLQLWHGLNVPLVMSVLALVGGAVIYLILYSRSERATGRPPVRAPVDAQARLRHRDRQDHSRVRPCAAAHLFAAPADAVAADRVRGVRRRVRAIAGRGLAAGRGAADASRSRVRHTVGRRRGLRARRGKGGEVPPPRGADHGRRRRTRHLPDVRVVFGAGSGAHADRSRSRHDGAVVAGAAVDAAPTRVR